MIAIVSLLITLFLSLLVTRIAAMALMLTGISSEMARFQARSAFTGCGFTTNESESIVNHPVRRRILMMLMLLGNLGIATVVATVMISLIQVKDTGLQWGTMLVLLGGIIILWLFATSRIIERHLNRVISWSLRRFARLEVRDYVAILQLREGYVVSEMVVQARDWLAERSLRQLRLTKEGVLVLGVQRKEGHYLGAPEADTVLKPGDLLILYGPVHRVQELDERRAGRRGDVAHAEAIDEHVETVEEQAALDEEVSVDEQLSNESDSRRDPQTL
ncbi:TrkA C-terminal domain-containing protein [Rubinisphaera margarita]|uniref:TrkA C-terminal domain-containing protein n=1 Tax=Rubinisphaera margarita TaxID=2909586 RepID=UPI001EE7FC07|nr:TrkA C-terminal domain-containing protein [Rubinisphaera margarita]MCG6154406.1 TrkA C-terminal domain-containing protein [Rubinisphaera margarita]